MLPPVLKLRPGRRISTQSLLRRIHFCRPDRRIFRSVYWTSHRSARCRSSRHPSRWNRSESRSRPGRSLQPTEKFLSAFCFVSSHSPFAHGISCRRPLHRRRHLLLRHRHHRPRRPSHHPIRRRSHRRSRQPNHHPRRFPIRTHHRSVRRRSQSCCHRRRRLRHRRSYPICGSAHWARLRSECCPWPRLPAVPNRKPSNSRQEPSPLPTKRYQQALCFVSSHSPF